MKYNRKLMVVISLIGLYIFWGGTYLGMKVAIETMPPFVMAGLRFVSAGAIMYLISKLAGIKNPTFDEWKGAGIVGALLLLSGNGMVAWAEQRISSGIASLLIATVPLWILVFGWAGKDGKRPSFGTIFGVLLGFGGIALLVLQRGDAGSGKDVDIIGILAVVLASISWSVGSLYSRHTAMPSSPLMSTAVQMLVGGGLLMIASFFTGEWARVDFAAISLRSYLGLGYLIFFGSIVAYNAYIWLLKNAEPSWVATYAYVNPVVAVFLGWLVLDEKLSASSMVSAVVIILAVVIITVFREKKA